MLEFHLVEPSDIAGLCQISEQTFRDAWQDSNAPGPFEAYCRDAFSREQMLSEIEHPDSEFYFIYDGGTLAAYCKINYNCSPKGLDGVPNIQLERIYVLQSFQDRGYGAAILRFTEQIARQKGAAWIWLSVWTKSPRTIRFYEKHGFTIFGTEIFQLGDDPQLDWLMKRPVSG